MPKEIVLTKQGLDELKAKIEYLQNERRREVAARIKEAREFGDISENAEYDDAKNEQAMLEKQISDLEEKLRSAKVIDSKEVTGETVTVGTTVHLKDQKTVQVREVPHRRLGGGERRRAEALERVADRQGAARQEAQRHRLGPGPARPRSAS